MRSGSCPERTRTETHITTSWSSTPAMTSALLDPAWLNGFKRRNRDQLERWGLHLTTESYVEASEYSEWQAMPETG